MPGIYTVTEQAYDKYEPQETHRVTVVAGQVAKVTFNNKFEAWRPSGSEVLRR